MEISSGALPAVAAERATMCVALELSKARWLVARHSPVADKVGQHRLVGGGAASLLVDRRSRRAKTDRLGAAGLPHTLMVPDRGESRVCRVEPPDRCWQTPSFDIFFGLPVQPPL
ncbi:MAG: hypothetical protein ACREFK_14225 [Stellaceae bacterium]